MSHEQYTTIRNLPIRELNVFARSHRNNQLLRSYITHCAPFLRRNILRAAYQLNH